jgi:hypothetical protein
MNADKSSLESCEKHSIFMWRKLTIVLISLALCCTTLACGKPPEQPQVQNRNVSTTTTQTPLSAGKYPVQQATYNDANGEYTIMLLNTPAGTPPVYRTTNLQMARLTDEEIKAGEKSYLQIANNQPAMHLSEDFKIEYVHNVTETQTNPQTGQPQTVVVRQQSGFWAPFAGAVAGQIAGQAIGNMLFRPQYYVPPVYQPGGIMMGYGGYGSSYSQAVDRYQTRYQAPPPAVTNRQVLRTTGRLRSPSYEQPTAVRRVPQNQTKGTGSGFGSSTLRSSGQSRPSQFNRSSGFGSGGRSSPSRSRGGFGSRRRR